MSMDAFSWSLLLAAAGIGLTHTLLGPDHYLPFIMLARARNWSLRRTAAITAVCGVGHVLSSVVLGGLGVAAGVALARVQAMEQFRGSLAAWGLVAFGLAYAIWGIRKALRRSSGLEPHSHAGHVHVHRHGAAPHAHEDPVAAGAPSTTFWALFAIFVLGPCEPLIPLFVLPASRHRWDLAALTAVVFGVITITAMTTVTVFAHAGLSRFDPARLTRWSHALAGGIIAASGLAVLFLGL
jgi:nickel/cobalt exporter